jgi:hypothetical protein
MAFLLQELSRGSTGGMRRVDRHGDRSDLVVFQGEIPKSQLLTDKIVNADRGSAELLY